MLAAKYFRVNGSNSYLGGWIIVTLPSSLSLGHSPASLLEIIGISLSNEDLKRRMRRCSCTYKYTLYPVTIYKDYNLSIFLVHMIGNTVFAFEVIGLIINSNVFSSIFFNTKRKQ